MKEPMKVMTSLRGGGKTYQAIQWMLQGEKTLTWPHWSRVMLVLSENEAKRLRTMYPEVPTEAFIPMDQARNLKGMHDIQYVVDNADQLFERILGFTPDFITLHGETHNGG